MGIILRNCRLNKTQLLATNLAKAVTVRLKLFHVEQFRFANASSKFGSCAYWFGGPECGRGRA